MWTPFWSDVFLARFSELQNGVYIQMKILQKYALFIIGVFMLCVGTVSAATLSTNQVNSIISLLQAFGVSQNTIQIVQTELITNNAVMQSISFGTTESTSTVPTSTACIPNPVMSVSTSTTSEIGNNINSVVINYTTGCLDKTGIPQGTGTVVTLTKSDNSTLQKTGQTIKFPIINGQNGVINDETGDWLITMSNLPTSIPMMINIGSLTQTIEFPAIAIATSSDWCDFVETSYEMRRNFNPELSYELSLCQ
jgi:hypothetical protein